MYSPALGRFIQPDTIVPDMYNPQSLNRYSYVLNNPIRYIDPTGHCPGVKPGIKCAANPTITTASVVNTVTLPQPTNTMSGCGQIMSCLPVTQNSNTIILNPTHINEQGNTIIAVPAQQPPGSPSVPTITTYNTTSTSTFDIISSSSGPVQETHWTIPVKISVLEYLGFTHYMDGESQFSTELEIGIVAYYPDQDRVINETTVSVTTITTYDQHGSVLNVNEVVNYSSIEQLQVGFSTATNVPLTDIWIPFYSPIPNIVYR